MGRRGFNFPAPCLHWNLGDVICSALQQTLLIPPVACALWCVFYTSFVDIQVKPWRAIRQRMLAICQWYRSTLNLKCSEVCMLFPYISLYVFFIVVEAFIIEKCSGTSFKAKYECNTNFSLENSIYTKNSVIKLNSSWIYYTETMKQWNNETNLLWT